MAATFCAALQGNSPAPEPWHPRSLPALKRHPQPVQVGFDRTITPCHGDSCPHSLGIIHAGEVRIGIACPGGGAKPAAPGRRQKPVVARCTPAALKINHHIPSGTKHGSQSQALGKVQGCCTLVDDHLVKPWHAARNPAVRRRCQKRNMRIWMACTKPGIGIEALDQVTKRAMLDHQNSCLCHA